ncbi:B3 domain-containing protein [Nymphaea thermarum]|nr:B3 domain-containing protein [Nymphaea thermarum]
MEIERRRNLEFIRSFEFNCLLGSDFNVTLQFIPTRFCHQIGNVLGEDAHLEDSGRRLWKVKISRTSAGLAFQQGWREFVNDHSLSFGDLLLFEYVNISHFEVQIFGRNCCEKERSPISGRHGEAVGRRRNQSAAGASKAAAATDEAVDSAAAAGGSKRGRSSLGFECRKAVDVEDKVEGVEEMPKKLRHSEEGSRGEKVEILLGEVDNAAGRAMRFDEDPTYKKVYSADPNQTEDLNIPKFLGSAEFSS